MNKTVNLQVYPPFGSGAIGQEGHNMCFLGADVWSSDAIEFLAAGQQ